MILKQLSIELARVHLQALLKLTMREPARLLARQPRQLGIEHLRDRANPSIAAETPDGVLAASVAALKC